ncbi:MAG TPA: NADH-quinone oxidoreductase subunit C [Streptosporangiaceae bacterium]|nr:NADH-quinone oxidoreductase subunit C [Streptosporangiaceae bacterium]
MTAVRSDTPRAMPPGLAGAVLVKEADAGGPVAVAPVASGQLGAVTEELATFPGARLADLFAAGADPVTLRMVWALDYDRRYLITQTDIDGPEYPALSDVAPAAFAEECEIYEQFGIRPAGGKPLNRVAMPPQSDIALPRLGRAPAEPPHDVHAPHVVGGHAFEFPFGPVRQAGVESLYYGLVTSGEELVDLYLFTWHKHRGVEYRAQGQTPQQALFHIERAEGLGAVANSWAFAAAAEAALNLAPGPAAQASRAIALELERLYNHAAAMAAMCQACGLSVGRSAAEIALEHLLRLNAAVFGHRYLFGVLSIGGTRLLPEIAALRTDLPEAYSELRRAGDALLGTNSFLDRLEATGIVTGEDARRLGLVGPVARASGVTADTRIDHSFGPYAALAPVAASQPGGDALARLRVMLAEASESVRLIGALLDAAGGDPAGRDDVPGATGAHGDPHGVMSGDGQRDAGGSDIVARRSGLGWAESSRGEAMAWVELDETGRISRARLRPAAVRNWRGFDDACRSQNVFTDIPIIEASFWLTVAGTAR